MPKENNRLSHNITLIPGDGIGPEITKATVKVINAAGVNIDWEVVDGGLIALHKFHDPLPQELLDSVARNKIALKGPLTTPIGKGFRSVNVAIRKEFDLYSNLRPCKTFKGVKKIHIAPLDIVIVRENLEEFYSGVEHYIDSSRSAAENIGIVTKRGCERIVKFAFKYAMKHNDWYCPICEKPLPIFWLYVDKKMLQILNSIKEDKVKFLSDGTWESVKN